MSFINRLAQESTKQNKLRCQLSEISSVCDRALNGARFIKRKEPFFGNVVETPFPTSVCDLKLLSSIVCGLELRRNIISLYVRSWSLT